MTFVPSNPYPWPFDGDLTPQNTTLLVIDMQTDFCGKGGYIDGLGYDISLGRACIEPISRLLSVFRKLGFWVMHTREGHRPDTSDAFRAKVERGAPALRIGAPGPMGRILIRGEPGHAIVPELAPEPGEPVVDKPGKGAFYATDLELILRTRGIEALIVCGVTTEVCVHTTVREANDRGYRCIVPADCTASYFPEFHEVALRMVSAQGGIFGWVSDSRRVITALSRGALGH